MAPGFTTVCKGKIGNTIKSGSFAMSSYFNWLNIEIKLQYKKSSLKSCHLAASVFSVRVVHEDLPL